MDVYATLQKSRLCPHYKRNYSFRTASLHNFGRKGVFLLTAREARRLVDCQLTSNAAQGFLHIHNHFCFLRTFRTLLLLPIFGFPFHFQASTLGFCIFLLSKTDTCAFPPPQAKETMFWKETGWKEMSPFPPPPPPFALEIPPCQRPLWETVPKKNSEASPLKLLLISQGEGRMISFLCALPLWIFKPFSDL